MRTAQGKVHVLLAVDRVSKLLHAQILDSVTMADGAAFMAGAVEAFPCRIHTALTDNGVCLTDQPRYRNGITATFRVHVFDRVRRANGIAHKLTKPYHPWTNGRAERMVRTLKEATVESFHYETRADLEAHLRRRVQSRQAPERAALAHSLPGDLGRLEGSPESLQDRSAPPHRGTLYLRGSDAFIPRLSLVAEVGHKIVGHIMLTKIPIRNGESSSVSLALAPLSVAPEFQGIGVGRQLVYEAHRIAKAMGYLSITVLGPAKYYSRFGYETMQSHGIEVPFDVKDENCMIIILDDQRSSRMKGRIEYSSAFLE